MDYAELAKSLWNDIGRKNWSGLSNYFHPDAVIEWPNTNEAFTVDDFIRANREYPGKWLAEVKRLVVVGDLVISVVFVRMENNDVSFYAISFFQFEGEKIKSLVEYWSENSSPPDWRKLMNLGGFIA